MCRDTQSIDRKLASEYHARLMPGAAHEVAPGGWQVGLASVQQSSRFYTSRASRVGVKCVSSSSKSFSSEAQILWERSKRSGRRRCDLVERQRHFHSQSGTKLEVAAFFRVRFATMASCRYSGPCRTFEDASITGLRGQRLR